MGTHKVSGYDRVYVLIIAPNGNFNIAYWCEQQQTPPAKTNQACMSQLHHLHVTPLPRGSGETIMRVT